MYRVFIAPNVEFETEIQAIEFIALNYEDCYTKIAKVEE